MTGLVGRRWPLIARVKHNRAGRANACSNDFLLGPACPTLPLQRALKFPEDVIVVASRPFSVVRFRSDLFRGFTFAVNHRSLNFPEDVLFVAKRPFLARRLDSERGFEITSFRVLRIAVSYA